MFGGGQAGRKGTSQNLSCSTGTKCRLQPIWPIIVGAVVAESEIENQSPAARRLPGPFWIDALCSNQADDTEKSAQVRMMREIYDKAAFITIWLERHDEESRICVEMIWACGAR
jgi:hypothetical protein